MSGPSRISAVLRACSHGQHLAKSGRGHSERLEILETSHPESVLAYVRPGDQREDDIIVLLNYDPKPVRAALPATAFIGTRSLLDLISGAAIPIASAVPAIDLPGWGALVLRRGTADGAR